jgi:hypothetical protein
VHENICRYGWRSTYEPHACVSLRGHHPYSDKKVANRNVGDFGWEIAHAAVSLYTMVARTEGYTFDANVWDLSIIQGSFFCRPVLNLPYSLRFATFSSLYGRASIPRRTQPCS